MERWLRRNLKYITLILLALLLMSRIQSCNRKMGTRIKEKAMTEECDSLINVMDQKINNLYVEIESLKTEIITRDYEIMDLEKDLEIAGIKVNAAERRADAVQKTAEAVKANTTIEIKGAERDTTNVE